MSFIILVFFKKSTPKSKIFENKLEMQNLLADFAQEEKRPVGRPKKKTANQQELLAFRDKLCNNMNNTIYDIAKKRYGTVSPTKDISRYGTEAKPEFFAELYANMQLSSEPTNLAKALKLYLKGKKQ